MQCSTEYVAGQEVEPSGWQRVPGESAKAYQAFLAYRDAGPRRTLRQVAEKCGAGQRTVEGWSATYHWTERCGVWADFQERESCRQQLEELRNMNARHVAIAKSMQAKAIEKLTTLEGTTLTPREVLSFLALAVKVERLAVGEPSIVNEARVVERPGYMSRAVLASPEALEKAMEMLDLVGALP